MINTVLIANRGEIALRVLRSCHELGMQTVAIYSEVDREALHVRYAGQAFSLGDSSVVSDSYLRMDKILEIAHRSGADAIHPGYGFLAERSDFAQAVLDEKLVWIGPPPAARGRRRISRSTGWRSPIS